MKESVSSEGIRHPHAVRPLAWVCVAVSCLLLLLVATHARFNPHTHGLPTGCDEFGYLNSARALAEGRTFADHASRPFIGGLLDSLRTEFPDTNRWRWMIAPHAYHFDTNAGRIINQYPPGVALLLGWLPLDLRRPAFPLLCTALAFVALLAAARIDLGRYDWIGIALPLLLILAALASGSLLTEFVRTNSLAPTYGLLLAAGWLLPRHAQWGLGILSATTVFRVPNALLFAPVGLAAFALGEPKPASFGRWLRRGLTLFTALLCGGFLLYLGYAYLLLGNPLAPTYSPADREFARVSDFATNARFYFLERNGWLWPNLVALGALLVACILRRRLGWALFGVALLLFNYGFYLFHKVLIPYYPYAPALLLAGLAVGVLDPSRLGRRTRLTLLAGGVIALGVISLAIRGDMRPLSSEFDRQSAPYKTAFSDIDVVWAEARSGTVEYTTDRAGFRYAWGDDAARLHAMRWLASNGHRQAVWVDDHDMRPRAEIEEFLSNSGLPHAVRRTEGIGDWILIEPTAHRNGADASAR